MTSTPHALSSEPCLVTGASGFIGAALVDALVERGMTVRCLTRGGKGAAARGVTRAGVEWHRVDWSDPRGAALERALDGARWIFHLAGSTKALGEAAFHEGNVRPTEALLAALVRRGANPERFVLVSSQAAGGPAPALDRPRDERDEPAPVDAYGRSKLAAERVVASLGAALPWTIVRPSSVYGPRDADFLQLFRQVRSGLWIYPATRDRWLSLAHVGDVVRGILAAAESSGAVGGTYHLAAEPPVSWREVYRTAAAAAGARRLAEIDLPQPLVDVAGAAGTLAARLTGRVGLVNHQKVALGRPRFWVCSAARARAELGFEASIPLDEGMRRTWRWYVENRWV